MILLGLILSGESIVRIPETWKCFSEISTCSISASIHTLISLNQDHGNLIQGNKSVYWSENW
jgi:hypothetical protein